MTILLINNNYLFVIRVDRVDKGHHRRVSARLVNRLAQVEQGRQGNLVVAQLLLDVGIEREVREALDGPLAQVVVLLFVGQELAALSRQFYR